MKRQLVVGGSAALSLAVLTTLSAGHPAVGQTNIAPRPKHRIGVRFIGGVGQLYDRRTGAKFVPRGANYVRLDFSAPQPHITFQVGRYDGPRAGRALASMRSDGYNAARVFVVGEQCAKGCVGVPGRRAINPAYVRNIADFLRRARANRIYVILTTGFPPAAYLALVGQTALVQDVNGIILTNGGIEAYSAYWRDLVRELVRQRAAVDWVLGYDITNEVAFVNNHPPFSVSSGIVAAPNGSRYDMSAVGAKDRLMNDGLVYWANRIRAAIRRVDQTALVTASFFEPEGPNPTRPGDTRILRTHGVVYRSALDFVDLHAYPGGYTLAKIMENYGVGGPTRKPVVMGELGAFKEAYATPADAARDLQAWQAQSCTFGFDGWLLWTWDSDEQSELWNGLSGGRAIEKALAPKTRRDPCAAVPASMNLALGKPAAATASLPENPPTLAVDGNRRTAWISGQDAPQSIEIDFGAPTTVGRISLVVARFPAEGPSVHRVWAEDSNGAVRLLQEFSGTTKDGDLLEYRPGQPLPNIRKVRVETLSSTSWVAWREIEVFGM